MAARAGPAWDTWLPRCMLRRWPDGTHTRKGLQGRCKATHPLHNTLVAAGLPVPPPLPYRQTSPAPGSDPCRTSACQPAPRGSCRAAPPPQSRWRWRCGRSPAPPAGLREPRGRWAVGAGGGGAQMPGCAPRQLLLEHARARSCTRLDASPAAPSCGLTCGRRRAGGGDGRRRGARPALCAHYQGSIVQEQACHLCA